MARRAGLFCYKLVKPVIDPVRLLTGIPRYLLFIRDAVRYSKMDGAEKIRFGDIYPCIHNKSETTRVDPHYFYQGVWAFHKIRESKPDLHVDVGSQVNFVGLVSVVTKVEFIDIRPLEAELKQLSSKKGSILSMPYKDGSVKSLSSLHVAEHIGLGRYGDPLDPGGTRKACRELTRVLAPGGSLYFSLPVGRPRLVFNAHRIHSPRTILEYFDGLKLVEFSGVGNDRRPVRNVNPSYLEGADYACGMYHFTKE